MRLENKLKYKVGMIGCPSLPDVTWNKKNLLILKKLGFNALQLNIAWGGRPADEPLNLEDVVKIPAHSGKLFAQPTKLESKQNKKDVARRSTDLKKRVRLCKETGFKTIFHFGAPYNGTRGYNAPLLDNCVLDESVVLRYISLLKEFFKQYPGVDDLWLYTYDQDAWLCNEFGVCERCAGTPLHKRVVPFVNKLAQTWKSLNPSGRVWWEPWELSHGQVLKCVEGLDAGAVGLAVHSNIGEVMIVHPVDRWLKSTSELAGRCKIPVIVETFLGGTSEELEPFKYLSHPLVTLRALQTINKIQNISGIKEYYGLIPDKEDPNLRMTGIFFKNPGIEESEALRLLALPYGRNAKEVVEFWKLCSESMELFPWNVSWFIREVGKCNISHSMTAAFIRGQQAHTPSWESSRRGVFMKTDSEQPDPWLLEDVQLRCELAAERMEAALQLGSSFKNKLGKGLKGVFVSNLAELEGFKRRALSYVYHLRETNLASVMRGFCKRKKNIPEGVIKEMLLILKKDMDNQNSKEPCNSAIKLLNSNRDKFLAKYFRVCEDKRSKGPFSVTSR